MREACPLAYNCTVWTHTRASGVAAWMGSDTGAPVVPVTAAKRGIMAGPEGGTAYLVVREERAQGVIEFALIAMTLLLILVGTIDFARFAYYRGAIENAARMGAEAASSHCVNAAQCGTTSTATSDSFVMWSAYCEGQPNVSLAPSYTSCVPGSSVTWDPSSVCSGTCTNCVSDICVSPSTRTAGTQVTVQVGYKFHPITFLVDVFFSEQSCFTGDDSSVNHHTLCATAIGRVS